MHLTNLRTDTQGKQETTEQQDKQTTAKNKQPNGKGQVRVQVNLSNLRTDTQVLKLSLSGTVV